MDAKTLISYSILFNGEYKQIIKAIKDNLSLPVKSVDNAITILDNNYPKAFLDLKFPPGIF